MSSGDTSRKPRKQYCYNFVLSPNHIRKLSDTSDYEHLRKEGNIANVQLREKIRNDYLESRKHNVRYSVFILQNFNNNQLLHWRRNSRVGTISSHSDGKLFRLVEGKHRISWGWSKDNSDFDMCIEAKHMQVFVLQVDTGKVYKGKLWEFKE